MKRTGFLMALWLISFSAAAPAQTNLDLATATNFNTRLDGAATFNSLGNAVATGDINGDGFPDLVVGANAADNNGRTNSGSVYIVYGSASTTTATLRDLLNAGNYNVRLDGAVAVDQLGFSVATGDINGDGFDDVIAGAIYASFNGRTQSGSVYAVLGSATLTGNLDLSNSANYRFRLDAVAAGDELGVCVATGDLNGDGVDDIITGARATGFNGRTQSGSVYAVLGNTTLTGNQDLSNAANYRFRLDGAAASYFLGSAVATGDINGDGFEDVLTGAPPASFNGRASSGSIYAVLGSATLTGNQDLSNSANYRFRLDGAVLSNQLGSSVATGDINGDGFDDVLASATGTSFNGRDFSGSVYAVLGNATLTGNLDLNTASNYRFRLDGAAAEDNLGYSVTTGDINGDGFDDVIASAATADFNSRALSGSVYAVLGSATLTGNLDLSSDTNYRFRLDGAAVFDLLGYSIATGDLNGDGFDDVLAGANNADFNGRNDSGSLYYLNLFTSGTPAAQLVQSPPGNAPPIEFDSRRLTIDFANGTAGTVSVQRLAQKPTTGASANTANVYWVITTTKTGITGTTLTFKYTDADVAGFTESALQLYTRPTGGGANDWTPVTGEVLDAATNRITATVNGFSEFTIGNNGDNPLPVTLNGFTGSLSAGGVLLRWNTATEQNNAGFSVLRSVPEERTEQIIGSYADMRSLRGNGTTTNASSYAFTDAAVQAGRTYIYSLRSVDFDGTVHEYPASVTVEVKEAPAGRGYALSQNYPNPFNPQTMIEFTMKTAGQARLKVTDMLGRTVSTETLNANAGVNQYRFNGAKLTSGTYFYQLTVLGSLGSQAGFSQTRKMLLVK